MYVNLANTAVGDRGVSQLILQNPGLRTLILQATHITDTGLCAQAAPDLRGAEPKSVGGVRNLPQLKVLDLGYCQVTDRAL